MSATFEQARDEMFALLRTALLASAISSRVGWPTVANDALPPSTQVPWARVQLFHGPGGQVGFGDGLRKYERTGTLITQVFSPRGLNTGYQLAKIVADALEGKATPRGVWFRNVRIAEAGADGNFDQINVIADFEYTEVK